MKKIKICIDCNIKPSVERRRCEDCLPVHNRNRSKKYYTKETKKRYGTINCDVCGIPFEKNRKNQTTHGSCKIKRKIIAVYNDIPRSKKGNTVGRQTIIDMGFILNTDIIVHHIDENPINNDLSNLLIMNRSHHLSLHQFLNNIWFELKKKNKDAELWTNEFKIQITQNWIKKRGIKLYVLKVLQALDSNTVYGFKSGSNADRFRRVTVNHLICMDG